MYDYTQKKRIVLKHLRNRLNLTQADVASLLGVKKAYICHIETGYSPLPKYEVILKLLEIYQVSSRYYEELVENVKNDKEPVKVNRNKKNTVKDSDISTSPFETLQEAELFDLDHEWLELDDSKKLSQKIKTLNNYSIRKKICLFDRKKNLNFERLYTVNKLISDLCDFEKLNVKYLNTKNIVIKEGMDTKNGFIHQKLLIEAYVKLHTLKKREKELWAQYSKPTFNGYRAFLFFLSKIFTKSKSLEVDWNLIYLVLDSMMAQSSSKNGLKVFRNFYFTKVLAGIDENVTIEKRTKLYIEVLKFEVDLFKRDFRTYVENPVNLQNFKSFIEQKKISRKK